ncbi:MAG: hypothetical protein U9R25_00725 [Chloroflexota bacterium]|nr:hypothetical protein [Chloroflexota bacterium]
MTAQFPPEGYVSIDSAVEGIEVFCPALPALSGWGDSHGITTFDCPQCGSGTAYAISQGGLACTYCGFYQGPEKETVGRAAPDFEFTVDVVNRAAIGWGIERKELSCQNCGAETSIPPNALSHTCPFCASNQVVQRRAPSDELRPRCLIPFQLEQDAVRDIARKWLGNSWMLPRALRGVASRATLKAIYLPAWTFDSTLAARWKAEVYVHKEETYFDLGSFEFRKRPKKDEKEWRWEDGTERSVVDDLLVHGSQHVEPSLLARLKDFELDSLVPYEPSFLAGINAQAYGVSLEKAWSTARHEMREQIRRVCKDKPSSGQIRNFSMSLDFADETWRYVLLPFYLGAYNYDDKTYQVLVNGETGTITGSRPVDWRRVLAVTAAWILVPLLLIVVAAVARGRVDGSLSGVLGLLAFVGLIVGGIRALQLLRRAIALNTTGVANQTVESVENFLSQAR